MADAGRCDLNGDADRDLDRARGDADVHLAGWVEVERAGDAGEFIRAAGAAGRNLKRGKAMRKNDRGSTRVVAAAIGVASALMLTSVAHAAFGSQVVVGNVKVSSIFRGAY